MAFNAKEFLQSYANRRRADKIVTNMINIYAISKQQSNGITTFEMELPDDCKLDVCESLCAYFCQQLGLNCISVGLHSDTIKYTVPKDMEFAFAKKTDSGLYFATYSEATLFIITF